MWPSIMSNPIPQPARAGATRPSVLAYANGAHFFSHLFTLIYPTVVLALGDSFSLPYGEMLMLSLPGFILFGAAALPAGSLGDRWSANGMLAIFFLGTGASAVATGFAASPVAMAVGLGAAVFCYAAVTLLKPAMGYDDSLDVFGVHGIGGAWGALAAGLFTWSGATDVVSGQILIQLKSIAFTAVFCGGMTIVILVVLKAVMGDLRVSEEGESLGLDLAEHSETAYDRIG